MPTGADQVKETDWSPSVATTKSVSNNVRASDHRDISRILDVRVDA